jgi:hypothetical protein
MKHIATKIYHKPTVYLKKDGKRKKQPARRPRTAMGGSQSLVVDEEIRDFEYL